MSFADQANLTFITANISFYNVSHCGKRVTRVSGDGLWNEGIYLNRFVVQQPQFSFKIVSQNNSGIAIGVAEDSSRYIKELKQYSWCYLNFGRNYDHNIYTVTPYKAKVNETVTVTLNVTHKTIHYRVQGNSTGPPKYLTISDSQFQLLRPIVQLQYVGNSVEIYP